MSYSLQDRKISRTHLALTILIDWPSRMVTAKRPLIPRYIPDNGHFYVARVYLVSRHVILCTSYSPNQVLIEPIVRRIYIPILNNLYGRCSHICKICLYNVNRICVLQFEPVKVVGARAVFVFLKSGHSTTR